MEISHNEHDWIDGPGSGKPRNKPYIWVTWLSKLMAGETTCKLSIWFRVHREKYDKIQRRGDLQAWTVTHQALVEEITTTLVIENPEAKITIEDQNALVAHGTQATLSGKPDLINRGELQYDIYDAKTGAAKESHKMQMLLYRWMYKFLNSALKVRLFLVYGEMPGIEVRVENEKLFWTKALEVITELASPVPLKASPSYSECRECDIRACPFRETAQQEAYTDLF